MPPKQEKAIGRSQSVFRFPFPWFTMYLRNSSLQSSGVENKVLYKYNFEIVFLYPCHKIQHRKFAKEHLDKPNIFWKQVLWPDDF